MTINANLNIVDVATVPIGLPRNTDRKLAVRALVRSQLSSADISYGFKQAGTAATFPVWEDAYSIGVRFNDERSNIFVDGKSFTGPHRKGEAHILYLSGVEQIDFSTPRHTMEVLLRRSFMREIADDLEVAHVTDVGRGLFHIVDDQVLLNLALRIHPYFDAPETLDPLLADHFMWTLGIYICARYGDLSTRRPVVGGLSTWQERLAKDIIEWSIVDGVGLAEIAALCGIRTSQFAHGFKRSTGMAPFQWLQHRRIARAKRLLAADRTPLADVALACGFADQSHLTRCFGRLVGATPGVWRAAVS
ncbi:AraC family transcriptional regulator [Bradyrhizobium sp. SK17]|uniref:helix-turn-helix domain-containing protein n=1 Tax=Bradyrhizobium sp. SK17 TaxID=2057741 RepID=UPI00143D5CA8|nr:AraC family transcriptional regulator [Bradyrhizobium sp. SK17]